MEPVSFSDLEAEIKRLRAALREAVEYADHLCEQGWGTRHLPGDSETFNRLKAIADE